MNSGTIFSWRKLKSFMNWFEYVRIFDIDVTFQSTICLEYDIPLAASQWISLLQSWAHSQRIEVFQNRKTIMLIRMGWNNYFVIYNTKLTINYTINWKNKPTSTLTIKSLNWFNSNKNDRQTIPNFDHFRQNQKNIFCQNYNCCHFFIFRDRKKMKLVLKSSHNTLFAHTIFIILS